MDHRVASGLKRNDLTTHLKHQYDGPRYVYSATASPTAAKRSALQQYLQTFFGGSLRQMMASRADLATRIGAVLDGRQRRGRAGAGPVTIACAAALVLVIAISPLMVIAAPQSVVTALPAETNTHAATDEPAPVRMAAVVQSIVQAPPGQPTAPAFSQQTSSGSEPQFEAASIKPVAPVSLDGPYIKGIIRGGPGTSDPTRITYSRVGVRGLLTLAYGLRRDQVIGPDWLDSERFEIIATIRPGATKEEVNAMVRNLVTERFHIALHHETRDMMVYELTVGKSGPKGLKASVEDPSPIQLSPEPLQRDKNGLPQVAPGRPWMLLTMQGMAVHVTARVKTLAAFADFLTNSVQLRFPVVDKTGLMGAYDFVLDFVPEAPPSPLDVPGGPGITGLPSQGGGPDIFAALQEQLGLRLEQKKGPVEVLVVDHADRTPAAN
jgi:uncharacterized protein (TIGR03435 family)